MNVLKTIPADAILEIVNAIRAKGDEYYKSIGADTEDLERISLIAKSVGFDEAANLVVKMYLGEEE